MNKKNFFCLLIVLLFLTTNIYASSPIFLKITKNFQEKAEISIILSLNKSDYWEKFINTLSRDFNYSGYFSVNKSEFVKDLINIKKQYSTEIILLGEEVSGGIKITLKDKLDEKILFKKEYSKLNLPHLLAHKICDDIILHFTDKPGIAGSKILFVSSFSGKYQLYQVDYDGENVTQLTKAEYFVHFPKWLLPYNQFLFVSYQGGWPKLVKKNILTEEEKIILTQPGLNACASPCQKTKEMAVVLSKTGSPEIYITDFDGNIIKRVTYSSSTNASPSFSPCGKMITFVSDRHGTPQIYTMTREGTRVKRISYTSNYSTSPSWSPDGNYISYSFLQGGDFGIALYEVSTGETKIIGKTLGSEEISWAPNSRHIVYSNIKIRPSTLMIIDIFTGEKRTLLDKKYTSFSPNWRGY